MKVAAGVGLRCAPYVINNDIGILEDFASTQEEVVIKPIHELTTCFEVDWHGYSIFVKKFTKKQLTYLFEKKPLSPVFLQKYIRKTMDVRVTMIGFKVFAVAIWPLDNEEVVDFRLRCLELPHKVIQCPHKIERSIIAYARAVGLNFAAFDFAVSEAGEWYFLECNPNGQWMWLEMLTGIPLVETFARHLVLMEECPVRGNQFQ